MHAPETVDHALELLERGLDSIAVGRLTGVSPRTVRDWRAGKLPRWGRGGGPGCAVCGQPAHPFDTPPPTYPYLLGLYLGDGCISAGRRDVFRLRISLDLKYPLIIAECIEAIKRQVPDNAVKALPKRGKGDRFTYVEVGAYSKAWPCWFPQHGSGQKHNRPIILADWQIDAVEADPRGFLRGLIQSDGCRFTNTGRDGWACPRYVFRNASEDILDLFEWGCTLVGVDTTECPRTVYVSKKDDVALLDTFIGPKA